MKNKSFSYAGFRLAKINKAHALTPKKAKEIILPLADRKGLAIALRENLPCLLIGETGTGKTSAIRYLAYLRKQPYVRISMTGYTTPDELIGSKSAKDGATYYEDGIITSAMRIGAILVIDELNATPPDAVFILHGLLDEDRQVTMPNGEVIKPHKNFRVFATMNPDYEGTKSVNRAFLDRFPIILEIDTLAPQKEAKLLTKFKVKKALAEKLVTTATLARKAYTEQKTLTYVSTRSLLQVAGLINTGLDPKLAYKIAVVKKTRKNEQQAFQDFYNAVFKIKEGGNPLDDPTPIIVEAGQLNRYKQAIVDKNKEIRNFSAEEKRLIKKVEELNKQVEKLSPKTKKAKRARKPKTKSGKIKVGDKVRAKKLAPYIITVSGWTGKVIKREGDLIWVAGKQSTAEGWPVETKYFEKI